MPYIGTVYFTPAEDLMVAQAVSKGISQLRKACKWRKALAAGNVFDQTSDSQYLSVALRKLERNQVITAEQLQAAEAHYAYVWKGV